MLRKRGKYWYVIYYNNNKKQVWVSTKKSEELDAQQFELDFLKAVKTKNETGRLAAFVEKAAEQKVEIKGMALGDAWDFYCKEFCREASDNIKSKKKQQLKNFFAWLVEHYPGVTCLHEITYLMAKAYSQHLIASGISNHTHNIYIGYLKEIFKRLMFPADIQRNQFDYIKPPIARHTSYRPLQPDEIKTLLKHSNVHWRMAILISLYSGFDFPNTRYAKWSSIETAEYNGREINLFNTTRAKTGAKLHVPIHPVLWRHLQAYRAKQTEREYILPEIFQTRGCEKQWSAIMKEAKITSNEKGKAGFHCFRHTFNSKLDENGTETGTRQRLSGHASAKMNLIYTHAIKPLCEAIFKIPKWNY